MELRMEQHIEDYQQHREDDKIHKNEDKAWLQSQFKSIHGLF